MVTSTYGALILDKSEFNCIINNVIVRLIKKIGNPVVAHPPCRMWGRLRQFAHGTPEEKALGPWAVSQVREFGGVLEHPAESTLWAHCGLPRPGQFPGDFGGWSIEIQQFHWGHRAEKATWLYIVGLEPADFPDIPHRPGRATHCVRPTKRSGR